MKYKAVDKSTYFSFKYFFCSLRVIIRGAFRSIPTWLSILVSILLVYILPILITPLFMDKIIISLLRITSKVNAVTYQVQIFESSMFMTLGFTSTLTSVLLVMPILLIINRIILNPIRSGQFLVYLATPVKKSTNMGAAITFCIVAITIFISVIEIGKYGIYTSIIEIKMANAIKISPEVSQIIVDHLWGILPTSIGYTLLFSIIIALLTILVGINSPPMVTNLVVTFLFSVTAFLYIGVQVALASISSFRENANWIYKVVGLLFLGAYPIFITLHGYVNAGNIDLLNIQDRQHLSYRLFLDPFLNDLTLNETGSVKDAIYVQEKEMAILMGLSIVALICLIMLVWKRKRIL